MSNFVAISFIKMQPLQSSISLHSIVESTLSDCTVQLK